MSIFCHCLFHLTKLGKKLYIIISFPVKNWGGRVVRWCWVNFQCQGVLLIWIIVGQGPIVLAVGVGEGGLDIFSLIYHFSLLSPSLWGTARYRLKYCLKGPLNQKQPTNQPIQLRSGIRDKFRIVFLTFPLKHNTQSFSKSFLIWSSGYLFVSL